MADDGYLIGYEDSNNNFVEVGRFNNAAEDTSEPILIEHTASGKRMELDGSGFDMSGDIAMNGNAIENAGSVSTEELLIGGVKYLEYVKSIDESGGSVNVSLPDPVSGNIFYLLRCRSLEHIVAGSLEVTADGVSAGDYGYLLNDGTYNESGADKIVLQNGQENHRSSGDLIIRGGDFSTSGIVNKSWAPNRPRTDWRQYLSNGVIEDDGYDSLTFNNPDASGEVDITAELYVGEWSE